jgi:hypothetical protein
MNINIGIHFSSNTYPFTSVIVWDIIVALTKVVLISSSGNVIIHYSETVLLSNHFL